VTVRIGDDLDGQQLVKHQRFCIRKARRADDSSGSLIGEAATLSPIVSRFALCFELTNGARRALNRLRLLDQSTSLDSAMEGLRRPHVPD
jgi:hypothetical protein